MPGTRGEHSRDHPQPAIRALKLHDRAELHQPRHQRLPVRVREVAGELVQRVGEGGVVEVILALPATVDGYLALLGQLGRALAA